MNRTPVVITALLAAPLSAQTSIETGGGVARLDHYSGGAFSSFRAQLNQTFHGLQISFNSLAADHRGLGAAGRTDLLLRTGISIGNFQFTVAPEGHIARDVELPSTRTLGVELGARGVFTGFEVKGTYERGLAWTSSERGNWNRSTLRLEHWSGELHVGAMMRVMSITEPVIRTDILFDDLDQRRVDTVYRNQTRQVQRVGVSMGWQTGRMTFDGRIGRQYATNNNMRTWWESNLAVRVAPMLSITAGHSQQAADPLLRLHGGRYMSLGLRLGATPGSTGERQRPSVDPLAVEITPMGPSSYRIRFAIPGARRSASLSGDITSWKPVELVRLEDGRWEAQVESIPGIFRINIRADGGDWAVPPGFPSHDDGFGGKVGLLLISRP